MNHFVALDPHVAKILLAIFLPILACVVSLAVYPYVLRFAKKHDIVDSPNARKLQRQPVPVMGGVAVFIGFAVALVVANLHMSFNNIWISLVAITVMMLIGVWDDIKDVPAGLRFTIEIVVVWAMMYSTKTGIDDFHGLWNLYQVDALLALPLTVVAGVGIINAMNLIDGVDGYSSGFGIMASMLFAALFFCADVPEMACFSLIIAGALVPFFLHNVFAYEAKMYIGDSGTLMLGTSFASLVFFVLSKDSPCNSLVEEGVGLVPFTLAVMAIPVFDTLRVMSVRILKGISPFRPDKTHLHHLFIEMGFSHLGTTFCILAMNFIIVAIWFVSMKLGASIELQIYIVVGLALLSTFGFYNFMRYQQKKSIKDTDLPSSGNCIWAKMCKVGKLTHAERTGFWKYMRDRMDDKYLLN